MSKKAPRPASPPPLAPLPTPQCPRAPGPGLEKAHAPPGLAGAERASNSNSDLSAASTHAAATLQLHLRPEATDAHIENLTGLNDKAMASAAASGVKLPRPSAGEPPPPPAATNW